MEMLSKLEIGIRAFIEGLCEDDMCNIDEVKVNNLGLTIEDYNLCRDWYYLYSELHRNDTVRYGCDCGCGGDYMDLDEEYTRDAEISEEMGNIEVLLGSPPNMGW